MFETGKSLSLNLKICSVLENSKLYVINLLSECQVLYVYCAMYNHFTWTSFELKLILNFDFV